MASLPTIADLTFADLLQYIHTLDRNQKLEIWELLEAELLSAEDDLVEIEAARADYQKGDYLTIEQYIDRQP